MVPIPTGRTSVLRGQCHPGPTSRAEISTKFATASGKGGQRARAGNGLGFDSCWRRVLAITCLPSSPVYRENRSAFSDGGANCSGVPPLIKAGANSRSASLHQHVHRQCPHRTLHGGQNLSTSTLKPGPAWGVRTLRPRIWHDEASGAVGIHLGHCLRRTCPRTRCDYGS